MNLEIRLKEIRSIINSEKGSLAFFESNVDMPFAIKRIYYIYNVPPEEIRGSHAHKSLNQILFCPHGEIMITLKDGNTTETVLLDRPNLGLIIYGGIWRELKFLKADSVLVVAASDYYDENDYIRNWDDFMNHVTLGYWK